MTTNVNNFLSALGDGLKGASLNVTPGVLVNQGDLVYWDGTTLRQLALVSNKDTNAASFVGVANKGSNLGALGDPTRYPALYVPQIRAEWSGIWRFHTTSGDTYHELDQVFLGADSQTITNSVAAASGNVAIGGTKHTGDVVTVTIDGVPTSYTVQAADTLATIASGVAAALQTNAEIASLVSVVVDPVTNTQVDITAKTPGSAGNSITLTAAVTGAGATTTATASGATLSGGNANLQYPLGNIHFLLSDINTYLSAPATVSGAAGTDVPVIIPHPILPSLAEA